MIRKIYSAFTGTSRLVQVLIGLAFLVILAFTVTNLLSTRSEMAGEAVTLAQPTPTGVSPSDAEGDHREYLPLITKSDGSEDPTKDWLTYTDDVAGFRFKYPQNWTVSEEAAGYGVTIITPSDFYRGIRFFIEDNPNNLPPVSFVGPELEKKSLLLASL